MSTEISEELTRFEDFGKLYRWSREVIITEKIDGTNAQVNILPDGTVLAGSRNRYITPEADNFGFARWVKDNEEELRTKLGPGRHYGEWWGSGIQRGYDLPKGEKRFSLFNTSRWTAENKPNCCSVVPVLTTAILSDGLIEKVMENFKLVGSYAAPGFMKPEGIVIFHTQANFFFKKTFEKDVEGKSR